MTRNDLIEKLEDLVADLKAEPKAPTILPPGMTIPEAASAVYEATGQSVAISLKYWQHTRSRGGFDKWEIWDSKDHYQGRTLAEAVHNCLEAHDPQPPTGAEVQAAIDAVTKPTDETLTAAGLNVPAVVDA